MPRPPSKRIAAYATSESIIDDLPPTQKRASTSTQRSLHRRPRETRWTSMPPDDSNSQGERRTDSHDEQSRENVTTAERKDISQKNAPSPGKNEFHGEDHTGPRKPPSRRRPKKNRRETTTLGNKCRQPPPEGNTCCQTRRRPPVLSTNHPIRPRGENCDQSTNPGNRRERMHHYSLGGQWGIRKLHR